MPRLVLHLSYGTDFRFALITFFLINDVHFSQELVKRGAMDIPDNEANYRSMLKRLMVELVADEEKRSETRRLEIEAKQKEDRDRLKEERERKKQEALERCDFQF